MKIHVLAIIALLGLTACGEEEIGTATAPETTSETAEIAAIEPVSEEAELGLALAENTTSITAGEKIDQALENTEEALENAGNAMSETAQSVTEEINEAAEETANAAEDALDNVTGSTNVDTEDGQAAVEEAVSPAA